MVSVLSGQRARRRSPDSISHWPTGAGHALPALLATETPDRVPTFDVSGANDGRNNRQNHEKMPWDGDRSQSAAQAPSS